MAMPTMWPKLTDWHNRTKACRDAESWLNRSSAAIVSVPRSQPVRKECGCGSGPVGDPPPQFSSAIEDAIRYANERWPTTVHPLSPEPSQGHWQFFVAGLGLRQKVVIALVAWTCPMC